MGFNPEQNKEDIASGSKWGHAWTANWYDFIKRAGGNEAARGARELEQAGDNFASKFEEAVGRQPTMVEAEGFFQNVLKNDDVGYVSRPNDLRPIINSYVYDTFGGLAEKEKSQRAKEQSTGQYDRINGIFQKTYGRDATQAEKDHFGKLAVAEDIDDYTLEEALKNTEEYQAGQDNTARGKLREELQTSDANFFSQKALPAIQSRFAQQGRTVDGSSFASAAANAAQDINNERENYLATVGREDYVNRRQASINTYMNNLARNYQTQDQATARGYQLEDASRGRANELQDYDRQQRAYESYLARYGKKKKGTLGSTIGTLVGGGAGAYFGGPQGAMAGAQLGGTAGGMFDSY